VGAGLAGEQLIAIRAISWFQSPHSDMLEISEMVN